MLFSFFGSDIGAVRSAALKKLETLRGEHEVTTITTENGSLDLLQNALGAMSLFGSRGIYLLDMVSEDEELFEGVLELLPSIGDSANSFVVIEGPLKAAEAKALEKYSKEVKTFEAKIKKEWNVFALSDALLSRDKKTLWILLQEAWKGGRVSEEIIGTLFWQLKMVKLAAVTKSADEAGQKPFVYDKAKRALKNFPGEDLGRITHALVMLYHDGHAGKRDIDHALEAWVLSL